VHQKAHERVVDRVENAQHGQGAGHAPHGGIRQVEHLRQVNHQVHAHHGIQHIPADGAEAEEVAVAF
ncbi:hypothetical protein C1H57_25610, partial [Clostridium sp. 2-1]